VDAFVAKHLAGVSRTYAILIPRLPEPLAGAVGVAYLLMRIVDTLEDDPHLSTEQRLEYFAALEAALDGDAAAIDMLTRPEGDSVDERELMQAAPEVFARVRALEPAYREPVCACARAMSAGVRRLFARSAQRGQPYPAITDIAELREYCFYVAGVVGQMLCAVMASFLTRPRLLDMRAVATELGIGLQLVNILKDARKDSRQGRRYLPRLELYHSVLQETRESLRRGIDFVLAVPPDAPDLRAFSGLPIAWGALTLARAEQDSSAAKISREAVTATQEHFGLIAADDQAIREWLGSLLGC
jgi:farnesyl-diphosphate farnesyltransferase